MSLHVESNYSKFFQKAENFRVNSVVAARFDQPYIPISILVLFWYLVGEFEVEFYKFQFYNGGKEPLSLNRLLYLIWRNKQLLAAYEQQDAHEFFIAILDLIHK